MTLELFSETPRAGYAGPLLAGRHRALAQRFHFWRGASGRRYACTRYPAAAAPAYSEAVALFVRRDPAGPTVIALATGSETVDAPLDADEVHVHLIRDGNADDAWRDLAVLIEPAPFVRATAGRLQRCAA